MNSAIAKELDGYLKKQNITKKSRLEIINAMGLMSDEERNNLLDREEKKSRANKRPIPLEKSEQIEFVRWFKETYPGVVIMMIRNDGVRTYAERPEQLLLGLHTGASDLYVPALKCWIEMKRIKGGVMSDKQKIFRAYVLWIGDNFILAEGAESAKKQIQEMITAKELDKLLIPAIL